MDAGPGGARHAVDLDTGARLADLPAGVIDTLLDDVSAWLSARDGCPAVRLESADRDRRWQLGAGEGTVVNRRRSARLADRPDPRRPDHHPAREPARDTPVAVTRSRLARERPEAWDAFAGSTGCRDA